MRPHRGGHLVEEGEHQQQRHRGLGHPAHAALAALLPPLQQPARAEQAGERHVEPEAPPRADLREAEHRQDEAEPADRGDERDGQSERTGGHRQGQLVVGPSVGRAVGAVAVGTGAAAAAAEAAHQQPADAHDQPDHGDGPEVHAAFAWCGHRAGRDAEAGEPLDAVVGVGQQRLGEVEGVALGVGGGALGDEVVDAVVRPPEDLADVVGDGDEQEGAGGEHGGEQGAPRAAAEGAQQPTGRHEEHREHGVVRVGRGAHEHAEDEDDEAASVLVRPRALGHHQPGDGQGAADRPDGQQEAQRDGEVGRQEGVLLVVPEVVGQEGEEQAHERRDRAAEPQLSRHRVRHRRHQPEAQQEVHAQRGVGVLGEEADELEDPEVDAVAADGEVEQVLPERCPEA